MHWKATLVLRTLCIRVCPFVYVCVRACICLLVRMCVCVLNIERTLEVIWDNSICQSICTLCLSQLFISICTFPPVTDH